MRARSQSLIGLLAAFAGLLIVAVPAAALAGWSWPTQVYDGNFSDSSLAVDAHGHAHIAARGDTGIWYLTNKGGSWTRRRLTTDVWGVYRGNPYLKKTDTSPAISVDRSTDAIVVAYRHYEADPGVRVAAAVKSVSPGRPYTVGGTRARSTGAASIRRWWRVTGTLPSPSSAPVLLGARRRPSSPCGNRMDGPFTRSRVAARATDRSGQGLSRSTPTAGPGSPTRGTASSSSPPAQRRTETSPESR